MEGSRSLFTRRGGDVVERGGVSLSPVSAVTMLQKRGAISGIVAVNSHDLHAAGSPRQGSETPSCSGPAHNNHGDADDLRQTIYR